MKVTHFFMMIALVVAGLATPATGFSKEKKEIPIFYHLPHGAKVIGKVEAEGYSESNALKTLQWKAAHMRGADGIFHVGYRQITLRTGKPAVDMMNHRTVASALAVDVK